MDKTLGELDAIACDANKTAIPATVPAIGDMTKNLATASKVATPIRED